MNLRNIKPESVYRVRQSGKNFVTVDEILIYKDNNKKSLVVENNKFHKRLYSENVHEEILSEIGELYFWKGNRKTVLKSVCNEYRYTANYIIFHAADNYADERTILNFKEILNDKIGYESFCDTDLPF